MCRQLHLDVLVLGQRISGRIFFKGAMIHYLWGGM